jgi:hypothetical protein
MLIYGHDAALSRWAGDRLGISDFGPCVAIGVLRNEKIAAVAVFSQYRHPNIEISFVMENPRWATVHAVSGILRYPFVQVGCKRVSAITEGTNQRARAFLCRLGFQLEGIHPDLLPTGDGYSYGLLRKDAARWLKEDNHGQIESLTASNPRSRCDSIGAIGGEREHGCVAGGVELHQPEVAIRQHVI